jgi:DNA-binding transcriptional MerR regulator
MPDARTSYRIGEFASLAGVTVRTLHHYDRVGLLCPRRGAAGYRLYTARDLELLEQIVVLKFVGIPLRQIAVLLRASPRLLATTLGAQRGTLEKKRHLLDRAIAAIEDLENAVAAGEPAGPHLFKRIIEAIDMQDDAHAWTQHYDALVTEKVARLRALSPDALSTLRAQWSALVAEIRDALMTDPAGPAPQALGARWSAMLGQLMGPPADSQALAVHHRSQEWDPRMASFVDKPVWDFMTRVLSARHSR